MNKLNTFALGVFKCKLNLPVTGLSTLSLDKKAYPKEFTNSVVIVFQKFRSYERAYTYWKIKAFRLMPRLSCVFSCVFLILFHLKAAPFLRYLKFVIIIFLSPSHASKSKCTVNIFSSISPKKSGRKAAKLNRPLFVFPSARPHSV